MASLMQIVLVCVLCLLPLAGGDNTECTHDGFSSCGESSDELIHSHVHAHGEQETLSHYARKVMLANDVIAKLNYLRTVDVHPLFAELDTDRHVSYNGETGPQYWGVNYTMCSNGRAQSPINFDSQAFTCLSAADTPLSLDFEPLTPPLPIILKGGFEIELNIRDNPTGTFSIATMNGVVYHGISAHFHMPSEHRVDRVAHNGELHIKMLDPLTNNSLVLALFLNVTLGLGNPFFKDFINNVPSEKVKETQGTRIDFNDLFKTIDTASYWTYSGSLTTPPCSEPVTFVVFTNPVSIPLSVDWQMRQATGFNSRYTQPINGRPILRTCV